MFRKYGLGDKAKDQFEAVLGRFPDNIEALTELADIYKEKGDNPAAAAEAARARRGPPAEGRSGQGGARRRARPRSSPA